MPNLLADAGRFIARSPGAVAGIGAGLGAAAGVGREALRPQDQPKNYLGAGIRGAVLGGAAGGALGGIGHTARDTMLLRPELQGAGDIAKATAGRMGQGVSNFAQRQFHGLTGYGTKDPAYLDRIGMGGAQHAADKMKLVNLRAEKDLGHTLEGLGGIKDPLERGAHQTLAELATHKNLAAQAAATHAEGAAAQGFRDLGMTSVPGALKGAVTNPREASKAIWKQLRSGGSLGLAAGVGIPGAIAANDLRKGDESAVGGRTVGQKVLRHGANIGSGMLLAGVPMFPGAVAGGLAEAGGKRLGDMISPAKPVQVVAPAAM